MKQHLYLILFLSALTFSGISAQTAPDFTVTDSWGYTHTLYADYLDQDKSVVLKIFYVACPPCNSIAPYLEPLYQSWGGGNGDVQFIELSIKQDDTDDEVNVYKNTHSTTYPAAGGEGNSVPATVPYTNGTFGLWGGTPTFIVIAPDGTLEYDVYGIGNQGTIDALNAAIAATGAQGLPTGIKEADHLPGISLYSNLVTDELQLNVEKELGEIKISIFKNNGEAVLSDRYPTVKGLPVNISLASLSAGVWICRITDEEDRFMASYLFVKI